MDDLGTVTANDVDDLNRSALNRSAAFARLGGTVLVAIGLVGLFAWGWLTVRQQQQASPIALGPFDESDDIAVADRITLATGTVALLVYAGIAIGLGLLARMAGHLGQIWAGGSITGLQLGDDVPYEEIDLDED